jgi:ribosome-associated protein
MLRVSRRLRLPPSAGLLGRRRFLGSGATSSEADVLDVVGWLRAERAKDVVALDVSQILGGAIGEKLVFATGMTRAHMLRCAKAVRQEFKARGVQDIYGVPPVIEGERSDEWLVVDGGSVVVSIMVPEARERLALEEHWEEQGGVLIELPAGDAADALDDPWQPIPAAAVAGAAPAVWSEADGSAEPEGIYRDSGEDDEAALQAVQSRLEALREARRQEAAADGDDEYMEGYEYVEEGDDLYYYAYEDEDGYLDADGEGAAYYYTEEYGEEYARPEEGYYEDEEAYLVADEDYEDYMYDDDEEGDGQVEVDKKQKKPSGAPPPSSRGGARGSR